ncbi:MAG: hypothetical protein Fur0044_43490 [Anaerolineae bacterium]|nr:hypothetical protein [Anaerolineales bacterium]MCK6625723.1 hypothetical protein [Anaerolineae bacterium]
MTTKNGEYPMINSPIKWVGGKSRLRKQIVALLPPDTCSERIGPQQIRLGI